MVEQKRETVYVLGAGFSKGCGYPLTSNLLPEVWGRLDAADRSSLAEIIKFHHPKFQTDKPETYPPIEQLLTEMKVNGDLYEGSRRYAGNFKKEKLDHTRAALLNTIAHWFHEIYKTARNTDWLNRFVELVRDENAAVVTFNWDLLVDQALFGNQIESHHYGLNEKISSGPIILKPHGSLNWYSTKELNKVSPEKRKVLYKAEDPANAIELFTRPRAIQSKVSRTYAPLIVPPTYIKDFQKPVFRHLWLQTTEVLSTAKRIVFIGYSLPPDDLQAKFILRCGFHNQREGILAKKGREKPTGDAEVTVVNPDLSVAQRIQEVVNFGMEVKTRQSFASEWIEGAWRKSLRNR